MRQIWDRSETDPETTAYVPVMFLCRATVKSEKQSDKYLAYHDRIVIFLKRNAWYPNIIKNKANNLVKTYFIPSRSMKGDQNGNIKQSIWRQI